MSVLSRLGTALIAASLLLCGRPALAEGAASVSISNVQIGALDFTPDDGIAAGFSIDSVAPHLSALLYSSKEWSDEHYPVAYQPASARVDDDGSFAEASTTGKIGDLAGRANAAPDLELYNFGYAGGVASEVVWLTLRPNTVLIVRGHIDLVADASPDEAEYRSISFAAVDLTEEGSIETWATTSRRIVGGSSHNELHDDFALSFINASDADSRVAMEFTASFDVYVEAQPVPEPGTWSMLCAGLVLLGVAGRHARRQR